MIKQNGLNHARTPSFPGQICEQKASELISPPGDECDAIVCYTLPVQVHDV